MNEWCVRVCLFFFRFRNIEFTYVFLQIEYRCFLTFEVLQSICSSCNRYIWIHILINPFYFIILIRCWFFLIYFVHVVFIAYIFSLHHSNLQRALHQYLVYISLCIIHTEDSALLLGLPGLPMACQSSYDSNKIIA